MLQHVRASAVCIDRKLVAGVPVDAERAGLAKALIALARGLNFDVVAKGVETNAQREFLAEAGCRVFQGDLFAPPGRPTRSSPSCARAAPHSLNRKSRNRRIRDGPRFKVSSLYPWSHIWEAATAAGFGSRCSPSHACRSSTAIARSAQDRATFTSSYRSRASSCCPAPTPSPRTGSTPEPPNTSSVRSAASSRSTFPARTQTAIA